MSDLFSSRAGSGGAVLRASIQRIEEEGRGVILYLEPRKSLADEIHRTFGKVPRPADSVAGSMAGEDGGVVRTSDQARQILRRFGLGAQMLAELGIRKLRLISNSQRRIAGISAYGLDVVEHVPVDLSGHRG